MSDPATRAALSNPVWAALTTNHRAVAVGTAAALRYPADVVPFAAVPDGSVASLEALSRLLADEERLWLVGPTVVSGGGLEVVGQTDCFQLIMPADVAAPTASEPIVRLAGADAPQMLALTRVAFPGFFRAGTYRLGAYYGIRGSDGQLLAMAGERFSSGGCREISAVCTHPSARGRGYASALVWRVIDDHRRAGLVSWLHVATDNTRAVALYRRLGFIEHATIRATLVSRRHDQTP